MVRRTEQCWFISHCLPPFLSQGKVKWLAFESWVQLQSEHAREVSMAVIPTPNWEIEILS